MPGVRVHTRPGELIERGGELEEIELVLNAARDGDGRVLLIEGQPGIGKTALLESARRRAAETGLTVLHARGGELERNFPHGVVRQLFEQRLRGADARERRRLLAGAAHLAAPVLAGAPDPPDEGAAEANPAFGLVHALYWLTLNLSERTPLVLVVDDMQWADGPSLRFLLYIAHRLAGTSVSLLATARQERDGPDHATQLAASGRAIAPAPLSEHAVAQLIRTGLDATPDELFTTACTRATGGVPFLVNELVEALAADAIVPTAEHAAYVQGLGPRTVARATLVRLGRMPAGCVELARAVAVLAADAELPRAARLAGLEERDALEALDALAGAHVLQVDGGLRFVHPILRAAIYDDLSPGARSELHHRAARLLAAEGVELDAIAAQLLASEPTGSEEAVRQLREAAALARARGAPENALAYLDRALQEGCGRELRAQVAFERGIAARLAGAHGTVRDLREAKRLAADPVLRNSATLELATVLGLRGAHAEPLALLREALSDLGERAPELSTRLECLLAGMTASDPRLAGEFDGRAAELERLAEHGGTSARPLALLLAAIAAWRRGEPEEVVPLVARGWDQGRTLATGLDLWALGQGLGALVIVEELDRARELAEAMLAHARDRGWLLAFVLGTAYGGWIDARRGALETAEEALRTAIGGGARRANFALASQLWFAMDVILERPQAADLAAIAEGLELGELGEVFAGALLLDLRGRARALAGEVGAAVADLERAGGIFDALGFRNPNASCWRSALASALPASEREQARRLAQAELADARRIGHARGVGVSLRTLGLIEGGVAGRKRLEQSVSALASSPARLERARSLLELGAAMRRAGERRDAREPLRASLDIAVACGAERLAERARTELAASGARPRRERATGRDSLTPSELRVALLAAEGRTNNEIAQHLFVTPKTVDSHLSHVYAKLDISSRRALGAALAAPQDGADIRGSAGPAVT